jgi:HEPN domain-containing protein
LSDREARAEADRWLRQAAEDLDTAQRLADIGKHYAACFFAQQAAEKAVKASLYGRGAEMVRGHSVADLLAALTAVAPSFEVLRKRAAPLDAYYIPTRYPNGLAGGLPFEAYGPNQSADALAMADEVLAAVRADPSLAGLGGARGR